MFQIPFAAKKHGKSVVVGAFGILLLRRKRSGKQTVFAPLLHRLGTSTCPATISAGNRSLWRRCRKRTVLLLSDHGGGVLIVVLVHGVLFYSSRCSFFVSSVPLPGVGGGGKTLMVPLFMTGSAQTLILWYCEFALLYRSQTACLSQIF